MFRTDRNNNPTAMTTDVARSAGLIEGVDYVRGDKFPGDSNLYTAKLIGNPVDVTIKAIDNAGFQTQSGKPRWSYINMPKDQWDGLTKEQKTQVIAEMYQNEGGNALGLKTASASGNGLSESDKATLVGVIHQMEAQGRTHDEISKVVQGFTRDHVGKNSYNPTPFSTPEGGVPAEDNPQPKASPLDGNVNTGVISSEVASKLPDFLKGSVPNVNDIYNTAKYVPGELVHSFSPKELLHDAVEPELKGLASGARAIQSTPQMLRGLGGLLTDIIKTKPSTLVQAALHPTQYSSPRATSGVSKAYSTQAKPLLGQKTLAGSSNLENAKTALTAGLQALTSAAPAEALSGAKSLGNGLLGAGKFGLNVLGKGLSTLPGLGSLGLLGYLINKEINK